MSAPWPLAVILLLAAPLNAKDAPAARAPEPAVAAQTDQAEERVVFQLTTEVWRTNGRRVVTGGGQPAPPLVAVTAIGLMDTLTGLVTIPYDLVAAPFRKSRKFNQTTWKISGRLLDKDGHPRAGLPLLAIVDRLESSQDVSPGEAARADARTDSLGYFNVSVTGRCDQGERADIRVFSSPPDGVRVLESRVIRP